MPSYLRDTLPGDRPRERLRTLGPGALTAVELLAILLGTGTSSSDAVAVAGDLLASADGSLRALARRPVGALAGVRGVGAAKAARVAAALELARRVAAESDGAEPRTIRGPADVHRLCAPGLRDLAVEEFRLLALDTQHRVVRELLITRGLLDSSLVHPREVFRAAIAEAAAGIVVLHNHPSGNPAPSADDRTITRQLVEAGRLLDIPVYDHVIVGGDRYFSFAEAGLL
jgi:DNA repair protein RadC